LLRDRDRQIAETAAQHRNLPSHLAAMWQLAHS
jgi:hypothetical protein